MADEPVIIGRGAAAKDFPSDLPSQLPKYPGKALTHRFSPTDQPRLVEETTRPDGPNLAGTTPFRPIASFSYPDKNVYLGPVSNVRHRGLQPVAIDGKVILPTGGDQPFAVSEELRRPLEARINRLTAPSQEATLPPEQEVPPTISAESIPILAVAPTPPATPALTELERLRTAAIEELAKRGVPPALPQEPPTISTPPVQAAPPQEIATILPKPPSENRPIAVPEVTELKAPPSATEGNATNLISEAERLEAELAETLKQITSEKTPEKPTHSQKEKEDDSLAQISQLVTDRTQLLKQVNDLTAASKEEQTKRQAAETKMEEASKELNRQTQSMRIEKTNLGEQVKTLEQKISGLQEKQELIKEASGQVVGLKNQLATVEKERNDTRDQVKKLQGLLLEIQKSPPPAAEPKKTDEPQVAAPQFVEPSREAAAKIRVVKPQIAVGKMAPSLTSAPNVINGIVKDTGGYLLSNAIIVVKDKVGEPVRALKTNKIGQFAISTPLPNGVYTMELEAEGHNFDVVQVEVEGKVLPPLEIRANS